MNTNDLSRKKNKRITLTNDKMFSDKKNVAFKPSKNVNIHISGNATAVHPYFSEKGAGVKKTSFINNRSKVKYFVTQLEQQSVGTASETYKAGLFLEKGIQKYARGIAKKQLKKGDLPNASCVNLEMEEVSDDYGNTVLGEDPRMLARQVASWKVARTLNIRVLPVEKYAFDKVNTNQGKALLMGVSALLPATSVSIEDLLIAEKQNMDSHGLNPQQQQTHLGNVIFSGAIQKQLSDLQLIDAITGQTDRRAGNIFVDLDNQKVHGIDNDQSFGHELASSNTLNALASFKLTRKITNRGKFVYDESFGLEYTQNQIDENSAQNILDLSENDLKRILNDKAGKPYDEYLNDKEIEAALKRLAAIKRQIIKLKKQNRLIKTWDGVTYNQALDSNYYGGLGKVYENGKGQKYQSYVAREVNMYAHSKDQFGN